MVSNAIYDTGYHRLRILRTTCHGGSGCNRCPERATSSPGSLVSNSCYCAFGYLDAPQNSSLNNNSSLTCLLSFSSTDFVARFVDLGNPGESYDQLCFVTGQRCQDKHLQGVCCQSDVQQTLTTVDVSFVSVIRPPPLRLICLPVCTRTTRHQGGIQRLVSGTTCLVMLGMVSRWTQVGSTVILTGCVFVHELGRTIPPYEHCY
jgi:hypothetical protein